jgi:sulfate permease, SulP family
VFIVLMGMFDLGQLVNFIPSAVIAGFTSGIAVLITVAQIDNILGIHVPAGTNALGTIFNHLQVDYTHPPYTPNPGSVGVALLVMAIMFLLPKRINERVPAVLIALVAATVITVVFNLNVPQVGNIPATIILDERPTTDNIPWMRVPDLIAPALSIAALGAIESLLAGAAASRFPEVKGSKFSPRQELIAQGLGNMIIPLFGGIPASAVISRSSVAIRSGARTRVSTLIHSLVLVAAVLLFAPLLARVPLAALAGSLVVVAIRMNDWQEIRSTFGRRFRSAMIAFTTTLLATAAFDLTRAVIYGVAISAVIFVYQISRTKVVISPVDPEKMRKQGYTMRSSGEQMAVVYVIGPLFFGTVGAFADELEALNTPIVILSLRTVPLVDTTGLRALEEFITRLEHNGGRVYLSGLNEPVQSYLTRAGILQRMKDGTSYWNAFDAIMAADQAHAESTPA